MELVRPCTCHIEKPLFVITINLPSPSLESPNKFNFLFYLELSEADLPVYFYITGIY